MIPFLLELRAVLDWSCTPTTLKLADWLKLEDVRASLYERQCDLNTRAGRRLGDRQPRRIKILQVIRSVCNALWRPLTGDSHAGRGAGVVRSRVRGSAWRTAGRGALRSCRWPFVSHDGGDRSRRCAFTGRQPKRRQGTTY
jgi:hypothetical protein